MPLDVGSRLGPYEIIAPIGAGGMGEVYKARDTRLDRVVAIKVAGDQFSERFERESRAVAALNHPHICQLYDIGPNYLVMEYVEGAALRGPVPLEQALQYAAQISEALEAAHKKGITHRDLKPANILVTKAGVKLLDFGLAKMASAPGVGAGDRTATIALTKEHTILGTLQYMAPEQLEGQEADARSDIFAFGAVLYEMLTGRAAFEGKSPASVVSAIMSSEPPPVSSLQPLTPASVDYVVKTCLAKDPDDRWQSAREVRRELLRTPEAQAPAAEPRRRPPIAWIAAAAVLGIVAISLAAVHFREKPPEAPVDRFAISPPEKTLFNPNAPVAISPDGRRLVFGAASADNKQGLWIRSLDALTAQPLAGTEGATYPFWSPDSRLIGFFADGKLKKVDLARGPAVTLCDAALGRGGTWNRDGVILFAPAGNGLIHRVSSVGGASRPVTKLDPTRKEFTHCWPWFLPDGRHFLYWAAGSTTSTIRVGSIDSDANDPKAVVDSPYGAVYANGYLLFMRVTTLMAQPFDWKRLTTTGDAIPMVEHVQGPTGPARGNFSASEDGLLAYGTGVVGNSRLAWFGRSGQQIEAFADERILNSVYLSPDKTRAAVSTTDNVTHNIDVWIYDVARRLPTRFTFDAAEDRQPIWSPDGRTIVFNSNRKGWFEMYRKASNGQGTEELLAASGADQYPLGFSPDGKFLLYRALSPSTRSDLWILPMTGDRKPFAFAQTPFAESWAQFSPDGHWIAYQSDESQRFEIYVAPFPGPGGKRQISTTGGTFPRWRGDGKEMYYLDPDNHLIAVEISLKGVELEIGEAHTLLTVSNPGGGGGYRYDVSADGQRFLVISQVTDYASEPLTLVRNWPMGLKR